MKWTLRVMKKDPEGETSLSEREEADRLPVAGDLRTAAREAAILAERFGLPVMVYLTRESDSLGDWLFACEPRGGGRFCWIGPADVVAVCEDRHGSWREEFPLKGGGHGGR